MGTPNVIAAMKKAGEQVGKSGLGNKKRWKRQNRFSFYTHYAGSGSHL
jgi:hypothetical protein